MLSEQQDELASDRKSVDESKETAIRTRAKIDLDVKDLEYKLQVGRILNYPITQGNCNLENLWPRPTT